MSVLLASLEEEKREEKGKGGEKREEWEGEKERGREYRYVRDVSPSCDGIGPPRLVFCTRLRKKKSEMSTF